MKSAELTFSRFMPITPVSVWVGPRGWFRTALGTPSGGALPGEVVPAGYYRRRLWCRLDVAVDGVALRFATPLELDHVLDVLARTPLPSTRALSRGRGSGPNSHWLSRLPRKAKTPKWRAAFRRFVARDRRVAEFRAFYAGAAHG